MTRFNCERLFPIILVGLLVSCTEQARYSGNPYPPQKASEKTAVDSERTEKPCRLEVPIDIGTKDLIEKIRKSKDQVITLIDAKFDQEIESERLPVSLRHLPKIVELTEILIDDVPSERVGAYIGLKTSNKHWLGFSTLYGQGSLIQGSQSETELGRTYQTTKAPSKAFPENKLSLEIALENESIASLKITTPVELLEGATERGEPNYKYSGKHQTLCLISATLGDAQPRNESRKSNNKPSDKTDDEGPVDALP